MAENSDLMENQAKKADLEVQIVVAKQILTDMLSKITACELDIDDMNSQLITMPHTQERTQIVKNLTAGEDFMKKGKNKVRLIHKFINRCQAEIDKIKN